MFQLSWPLAHRVNRPSNTVIPVFFIAKSWYCWCEGKDNSNVRRSLGIHYWLLLSTTRNAPAVNKYLPFYKALPPVNYKKRIYVKSGIYMATCLKSSTCPCRAGGIHWAPLRPGSLCLHSLINAHRELWALLLEGYFLQHIGIGNPLYKPFVCFMVTAMQP